jgi:hypothetical protein
MKYFLLVGMSCASLAFSQTKGSVGINTNTPKSTLDVSGNNNSSPTEIIGLQIPRTTRAEITAKNSLYGNNQIGAMIYVTDISGGNADKSSPRKHMTKTGVYQLTNTINGLEWWRIFAIDEAEYMYKDDGTLTGNRTVTMGDRTLTFKTHNSGKVVFENSSPTASVDTPAQAMKIIDGAQGNDNKVLVSDANGNATWQQFKSKSVSGMMGSNKTVATADTEYYTGARITLPPGKWIIYAGSTVVINSANVNNNNARYRSGYKFNFYLSENSTEGGNTMNITQDAEDRGGIAGVKNTLGQGIIIPFHRWLYYQGQQVIHNTSNADKTYYVKIFVPSTSKFGSDQTLNYGSSGNMSRVNIANMFAPIVDEKFLYAIEMADSL